MIIGLGSDIISIARIEAVLKRFNIALGAKILTPYELAQLEGIKGEKARACYVAKRFAAKEACAKALGTGFRQGIGFRDIGVEHSPLRQPQLVLTGAALERLHQLMPAGKEPVMHLSLSDDYPFAQAVVVISGE